MSTTPKTPTTAYCYHCGTHHPIEEMRAIPTKGGGKRMRCIKSIEAAKKAIADRDAFGKEITAMNKAENKKKANLALDNK
jgi:hypothetical protein